MYAIVAVLDHSRSKDAANGLQDMRGIHILDRQVEREERETGRSSSHMLNRIRKHETSICLALGAVVVLFGDSWSRVVSGAAHQDNGSGYRISRHTARFVLFSNIPMSCMGRYPTPKSNGIAQCFSGNQAMCSAREGLAGTQYLKIWQKHPARPSRLSAAKFHMGSQHWFRCDAKCKIVGVQLQCVFEMFVVLLLSCSEHSRAFILSVPLSKEQTRCEASGKPKLSM